MATISCKEETRFSYHNTRVLYLFDDVLADTSNASVFVDQLLELRARDNNTPIVIAISCHGGMFSLMMTIVDVIREINRLGTPVCTQVLGISASAACTIGACGTPGLRYVSKNSRIMMHQPQLSGNISVDATQLDIERKEVAALKTLFIELIGEVTERTNERKLMTRLRQDIERDRWFSADEAVRYKLADIVGVTPLLTHLPLPVLCKYDCEYMVETTAETIVSTCEEHQL